MDYPVPDPLDVDHIKNIASYVVSSESELLDAFNNVSPGETIWIGTPATPYEVSDWLELNSSNVTVIAQSPFAEDGNPIIRVADGANVGCLKIGNVSAVDKIKIIGLGLDGNAANQTGGEVHDGIRAVAVTKLTIRDCYVEKTHPTAHTTGGDGIAVYGACSEVKILGNRLFDLGDRGVNIASDDSVIANNVIDTPFDRCISLNAYNDATDTWEVASDVTVEGNYLARDVEGSSIGTGSQHNENIVIVGNVADNPGRGLLSVLNTSYATICGNSVRSPGTSGIKIRGCTEMSVFSNVLESPGNYGIYIWPGAVASGNLQISGNVVESPASAGIYVEGGCYGISLTGNEVFSSSTTGILLDEKTGAMKRINILENTVEGSAEEGIQAIGPAECKIKDNRLRNNCGGADDTYNQIDLQSVTDSKILQNWIYSALANQPKYSIAEDAACDTNRIYLNDVEVGATGDVLIQGGATVSALLPSARMYHGVSDHTIPTGTLTKLSWENEGWNTGQDALVNLTNNRFDIQEDGVYEIKVLAVWDASADWTTGDRADLYIDVNGSHARRLRNSKSGTQNEHVEGSQILKLSSGDYVEIIVYQDSGADEVIRGGNTYGTFEIRKLAASN